LRYLIDGHNLIAQLPDIDLEDPHDEAKLVFKLRGFAARTGHKVTVVFDGGLPGGVSKTLSTSNVTARFAAADHMNADQVLIRLIRKVKNSGGYCLVSSDREIIDAARNLGMDCLNTQAFTRLLTPESASDDDAPVEKDDNPQLSPEEVDEWLAIFSGDED
jgi:predicted RNA-binding protein with PIN domain